MIIADKIYWKDKEISKVYLGEQQVWAVKQQSL